MTDLQKFVWNEVDSLLASRDESKPVLGLAVSGGTDSRALLELMHEYPAEIHVIHIDHGLRPSSGDEAAQVGRLAINYGLDFHLYEYTSEDFANLPSTGLEAQARTLRYRAFEDWLGQGDRFMLLGHHADDQAETVLLQLLRGTHVKGLRGMTKVRDRFLRPLLEIRRETLEEYLADLDITAIEDESNLELSMTRNRIRHEVMPLLGEVFERDPVTMLLRTADALEEHVNAFEYLLEETYGDFLIGENDVYKVPEDIRSDILRAMLHQILPTKDLKRQHFLDMAGILEQKEFKSLDLPQCVFATGWGYYTWGDNVDDLKEKLEDRVKGDYPQIQPENLQNPESGTYDLWRLVAVHGQAEDGPWFFQVEQDVYNELKWKTLEVLKDRRSWRRKLKKWGVPAPVRERLPLCFLGDELVWVPGFRIERPRAGDICLFWHNASINNTI